MGNRLVDGRKNVKNTHEEKRVEKHSLPLTSTTFPKEVLDLIQEYIGIEFLQVLPGKAFSAITDVKLEDNTLIICYQNHTIKIFEKKDTSFQILGTSIGILNIKRYHLKQTFNKANIGKYFLKYRAPRIPIRGLCTAITHGKLLITTSVKHSVRIWEKKRGKYCIKNEFFPLGKSRKKRRRIVCLFITEYGDLASIHDNEYIAFWDITLNYSLGKIKLSIERVFFGQSPIEQYHRFCHRRLVVRCYQNTLLKVLGIMKCEDGKDKAPSTSDGTLRVYIKVPTFENKFLNEQKFPVNTVIFLRNRIICPKRDGSLTIYYRNEVPSETPFRGLPRPLIGVEVRSTMAEVPVRVPRVPESINRVPKGTLNSIEIPGFSLSKFQYTLTTVRCGFSHIKYPEKIYRIIYDDSSQMVTLNIIEENLGGNPDESEDTYRGHVLGIKDTDKLKKKVAKRHDPILHRHAESGDRKVKQIADMGVYHGGETIDLDTHFDTQILCHKGNLIIFKGKYLDIHMGKSMRTMMGSDNQKIPDKIFHISPEEIMAVSKNGIASIWGTLGIWNPL